MTFTKKRNRVKIKGTVGTDRVDSLEILAKREKDMKKQIKHCILVIIIVFLTAGAISLFLNNLSFNPDFSLFDAMSGATEKSHQVENEESEWNYSRTDIQLSDSKYTEKWITTGKSRYRILQKDSDTKDIVILSDKENDDYQEAVGKVAGDLETKGYHVRIKKYSEIMMLSLAHAGHFDVFLMSEEVNE